MTDKEKIRAEIERLYNQSLADEDRQAGRGLELSANVSYGKSIACKELLSFIDSLPEEHVNENRREAILKKAHELAEKAELIKGDLPKSTIVALAVDMAEWCDSHPIEEPVSEDLI